MSEMALVEFRRADGSLVASIDVPAPPPEVDSLGKPIGNRGRLQIEAIRLLHEQGIGSDQLAETHTTFPGTPFDEVDE
jgi:hypothetical protein